MLGLLSRFIKRKQSTPFNKRPSKCILILQKKEINVKTEPTEKLELSLEVYGKEGGRGLFRSGFHFTLGFDLTQPVAYTLSLWDEKKDQKSSCR